MTRTDVSAWTDPGSFGHTAHASVKKGTGVSIPMHRRPKARKWSGLVGVRSKAAPPTTSIMQFCPASRCRTFGVPPGRLAVGHDLVIVDQVLVPWVQDQRFAADFFQEDKRRAWRADARREPPGKAAPNAAASPHIRHSGTVYRQTPYPRGLPQAPPAAPLPASRSYPACRCPACRCPACRWAASAAVRRASSVRISTARASATKISEMRPPRCPT